jgi:hypothetical protein
MGQQSPKRGADTLPEGVERYQGAHGTRLTLARTRVFVAKFAVKSSEGRAQPSTDASSSVPFADPSLTETGEEVAIPSGRKDNPLWGGASVPAVASGANPLAGAAPDAGEPPAMTPGQSSDISVSERNAGSNGKQFRIETQGQTWYLTVAFSRFSIRSTELEADPAPDRHAGTVASLRAGVVVFWPGREQVIQDPSGEYLPRPSRRS